MFDFLDSDWFNIGLQILFVLFISYDVKKYLQTKKKEYILNIVVTIGFAIWALYPYYLSYVDWNDTQKEKLMSECKQGRNATLCKCLNKATFKEYAYEEYSKIDKNATEYKKFLSDAKEDCEDDSWF